MTAFTWPIYGHSDTGQREPVATFFTWSDATDYAMHPECFGGELRTLYQTQPRYDRRTSGYRAPEPVLDLPMKGLPNRRFQVAA